MVVVEIVELAVMGIGNLVGELVVVVAVELVADIDS